MTRIKENFKFRAWNKKENRMVNLHAITPLALDTALAETGMQGVFIPFDYNLVIEQFTGLKDKNGREIYEGDILLITDEDGRDYEVVCEWGIHRRTMDTGWEVDIPSFCFKKANRVTFPIVDNYVNKHDLEIMEVIGNIHKNPELLDKKDESVKSA